MKIMKHALTIIILGTAVAVHAAPTLASIFSTARSKIGSPYRSGRTGPSSFDCSGFIYFLLNDAVPDLPRRSAEMGRAGSPVARESLIPGDIVLYATTGNASRISHVALYLGNNTIIHAISDGPNRGVTITSMNARYWRSRYHSARRILPSSLYNISPDIEDSADEGTRQKESGGIVYAKGTYTGSTRYSEPHGTGTFRFINGDIYEGGFLKGVFSGTGTYTWQDGTIFQGQFKDGRPLSALPPGKKLYINVEDSVWETWDGNIMGDFLDWKARDEADFEAFKSRQPGND